MKPSLSPAARLATLSLGLFSTLLTPRISSAMSFDEGDNPPSGTFAIPWDQMTALQRHAAYFDRDGDGYITPNETYQGLRALGYGEPASAGLAVTINAALGTSTSGSPSLSISVAGITAGLHGSDTGIYNENGEFVSERFDDLFNQWDKDGDNALDEAEINDRINRDTDPRDVVGRTASRVEFKLLFDLAAEDGKISRERLYAFYDGTLFFDLEAARSPV